MPYRLRGAFMAEERRERVPILAGKAWSLGLEVSAAVILPPELHAAPEPERFLLTPVDPSLPSRIAPGDIVVGGADFAAGTVDEAPVRALLGARVAAVIACSFDARFAALALELGLPALEVNEA